MRTLWFLWICFCVSACGSVSESDAGVYVDNDADVPGADAGARDSDAGRPELSAEPAFADEVVDAPGDTGLGFGDASRTINGVRGAGNGMGGTDVFSLGGREGVDDSLTLRWRGYRVTNGPGVDFVVFENAFRVSGTSEEHFMEEGIVELSIDGEQWITFPHDYLAVDETMYIADPSLWSGFAGCHPVLYNMDTNPVDPFDFEQAGGDGFDLALLDASEGSLSAEIRAEGFAYLRIVTASTRVNPDTGMRFVSTPLGTGPDIDGVVARYLIPVD